MRVEVLYFASARDASGVSSETVDVSDGATVGDLVPLLSGRHPGLAQGLPSLRFAVGERFAETSRPLRPGDRVALIPPVSGG
jgi:molybdopterin converting factor subunit 1